MSSTYKPCIKVFVAITIANEEASIVLLYYKVKICCLIFSSYNTVKAGHIHFIDNILLEVRCGRMAGV